MKTKREELIIQLQNQMQMKTQIPGAAISQSE